MDTTLYFFAALLSIGVIGTVFYFVKRMFRDSVLAKPQEEKKPKEKEVRTPIVSEDEKKNFEGIEIDCPVSKATIEYKVPDREEETLLPPLVYRDEIPETEHIDTDCFAYFKGSRILLVEDNPINQKIVQKVLRHSGVELDIADNGKIALEKLDENPNGYDLVLMDISMPVMDGFEATKRIRSDKRFDSLPIVTFTAFNLGPEIERMFSFGANAYLTKPLNIHKLYTVCSLYLGNVNRGLSMEKMLEIQGLHVRKAIEELEGEEELYLEMLEQFVLKYATLPELLPKWIEKGDYARLSLECKMLQEDLKAVGADEMAHYVHEIRKHFIYRTEALLSKHRLLFRTRMQAILDTINAYLDHVQIKNSDFEKKASIKCE